MKFTIFSQFTRKKKGKRRWAKNTTGGHASKHAFLFNLGMPPHFSYQKKLYTDSLAPHGKKKESDKHIQVLDSMIFAGLFQSSYYILKCSAVLSLSAYPGRTPRKEGELPAKIATAPEAKSTKAKGSTERPARAVPKLDLRCAFTFWSAGECITCLHNGELLSVIIKQFCHVSVILCNLKLVLLSS